MNKKALQADILLLLTAAIWGFGFVAQRSGMQYIGPFAFNGIRFILGSLFLLPFIFFYRNLAFLKNRCKQLNSSNQFNSSAQPAGYVLKKIILPCFVIGSILFIAVMIQQIGIIFTTAGNAGFITGLYVILTPFFGIFLGRKTGFPTWIGSILTLTGLYFISAAGTPGYINPGDVLIIISAFFWTAHVLLIDRLMYVKAKDDYLKESNLNDNHSKDDHPKDYHPIDPLVLSVGQFVICAVLSLIGAFVVEPFFVNIIEKLNPLLVDSGLFSWLPFPDLISKPEGITILFSIDAVIPILYGGLGSVGIAYTLQVVAQRDAPPAHATIILCFEGCFAALGGMLLLAEKAGAWTLFGFAFMLGGMLATQWDVFRRNRVHDASKENQAGYRKFRNSKV